MHYGGGTGEGPKPTMEGSYHGRWHRNAIFLVRWLTQKIRVSGNVPTAAVLVRLHARVPVE
jgi:hypothetical protein